MSNMRSSSLKTFSLNISGTQLCPDFHKEKSIFFIQNRSANEAYLHYGDIDDGAGGKLQIPTAQVPWTAGEQAIADAFVPSNGVLIPGGSDALFESFTITREQHYISGDGILIVGIGGRY